MPFLFIYLVPPTPELVAILICRELKISIRQLEFMFNTCVDLKIALSVDLKIALSAKWWREDWNKPYKLSKFENCSLSPTKDN